MDLMERLEYLFLGGVIGFIVGYIVGRLRDIKSGVNDIKKELGAVESDDKRMKNERGVMTQRWSANIALFVVVLATLYAAIMSQAASNRSNDTADSIIELQNEQKQNLDCTTQVLFDAINALNERTTYSSAQTDANIKLVQAQYELLISFRDPTVSEEEGSEFFNEYIDQVSKFLTLVEKTLQQQDQNPYPTVDDLTACLGQTPEDTQEPRQ